MIQLSPIVTLWRWQSKDYILEHEPKHEGVYVSMKLPTFWVEECIDQISKGDELGSCTLRFFQMLYW